MKSCVPVSGRALVAALMLVVTAGGALAAGRCQLAASEQNPSVKVLHCGDSLVVQPASGSQYKVLYQSGQSVPYGVRLDGGALLIEFHPSPERRDFQILTPLAIAAVRGTKWTVEVTKPRTSAFVLSGQVAVTSRRLNEYVVLTDGEGVDISEGDTALVQKRWGEARVRALLARFGQ